MYTFRMSDERQKWLDGLKVGDFVYLFDDIRGMGGQTIRKVKVTKISPKRTKFTLFSEKSDLYSDVNKNGDVQYSGYATRDTYIEPITGETTAMFRLCWSRRAIRPLLENVEVDKLTQEQLDLIGPILKGAQVDTEEK